MLTANRYVIMVVALFLFWGCHHLPPIHLPDPRPIDYVVLSADLNGSAVVCVQVTPLMRFLDPFLVAESLCGETLGELRDRLRQQRRAN